MRSFAQAKQCYKIGIKNLLRPEVRDFWEKLGSYVAPEEEGGHVDLFVPLGASEAGTEVLSQLSQLTGTLLTAPHWNCHRLVPTHS
ncbi:hypothetical protein J1605_017556 [Eschrichtius robustus]|uniref:Uncharacterized protein n=1 Tax=Eschrichtius robustus TaxID=9764 RepID=A0AB34HYW6_ESCRO|nr:hypothetical protein J1605_017556 [Eschrichtius robustus]